MYIADLHIHSKYSRATSGECVPEYLDLWARRKGIDLIGTGDFTHPAWRGELKEKLVPAEEGLYVLREDARISDPTALGTKQTRFVVTGEISSIYKKNGKVRKVHNVILLPSLEDADTLAHKLEAIGNIHSDGRPILGLDSRDLLEITLESCPDAVFIPAHIWTPHFSLFGAFSGFDTIEECFGDLTPHIRALETGLSSDPPMNWRISALDRYNLISNSDAHSPAKLGREANLIHAGLSYPELAKALEGGVKEGFGGTIEFFPEEGKYHYDGHRNCDLCLTPAQADSYGGKCPVCGKKITIGVQHRVEQLCDREEGFILPGAAPFESLVPLPEVLAASTGRSSASKIVARQYEELLQTLGSEFYILRQAPLEEIGHAAGPCIREGIRRLRLGEVRRDPGYDGAYGVIHILEQAEIQTLNGQISLFGEEPPVKNKSRQAASPVKKAKPAPADPSTEPDEPAGESDLLSGLNPEQQSAVTLLAQGTAAIIAGPGTGKTKTLVTRIAYLVSRCGVKPKDITAVTFTNKAAAEMRERLEQQFGSKRTARALSIGTFHSICLEQLKKHGEAVSLVDEHQAAETAGEVVSQLQIKISPRDFLREVSKIKNGLPAEQAQIPSEAYRAYCALLQDSGVMDFDDLLLRALALYEKADEKSAKPLPYLLVDEFQDINPVQYRLIQAWNQKGKSLFVIGDPDQSIYGFRGSDALCFEHIKRDYEALQVIRLKKNYRSAPGILNCALPLISKNDGEPRVLEAQRPPAGGASLCTWESELSEAIFVAKEINRMVGGIDMLDAQSANGGSREARSFSDIAVLYRTHRQARLLEKCLRKESIPYVVCGREDFLSDDKVRGTAAFFRFLLSQKEIPALCTALKILWGCPADLVQSFAAALDALAENSFSEGLPKEIELAFSGVGLLQRPLSMIAEYLPLTAKGKPRALLERFAEENGFSGSEPFENFMNMAVFHKDMASFIQTLLLGQESDLQRSASKSYHSDTVRLMTLHGSKGLEFPTVFLCGVKNGCIPLESPNRETDLQEERRLLYVGMTRAKDELYLMSPIDEPSVFLEDIPSAFLPVQPVRRREQPPQGKQLSLFD